MMSLASHSHSSPSATEGQLAFLQRIAHDDQFRADVEADPQAKLAEFGLHIDREDLPAHVALPGKDVVRESVLGLAGPAHMRWFGLLG